MSRILQHFARASLFRALLDITRTCRTVNHSSLTETTSTDTAALNLQNRSVLCNLDKRNNRLLTDRVVWLISAATTRLIFSFACGLFGRKDSIVPSSL